MSLLAFEADYERRLDQCWHSVVVADVWQLGPAARWKTVSRDVRAGAVVMAMAEFEGLVKDCVQEIHERIEVSGYGLKDLRSEIRMLHYDGKFAAAAGSALGSVWSNRKLLADAHSSDASPKLPRMDKRGFLQPIGSETPKPAMVTRLWTVYGLPGQPFPVLSWRKSLGILTEMRNDVAHRRETLTQAMAGADKSASAVTDYIVDLRDLGKHVVQSLETYTLGGGYLA